MLSTLGMLGTEAQPFPGAPPPTPPWIVTQQMGQLFDVVGVNPTVTEVDPTIDILVVHHPKDLPESALYAIDQFALAGETHAGSLPLTGVRSYMAKVSMISSSASSPTWSCCPSLVAR